MPIIIHIGWRGQRIDKLFDKLFFIAEFHTGINGFANTDNNSLCLLNALRGISFNECEDIINVDFDLFNQLHFKDYIIVYIFVVAFAFALKSL